MKNDLHKGAGGNLFKFAKTNRQKETQAEKRLWDELRDRKLKGFKFRRQHPIAHYIADFYCHQCALIIELDGRQHQQDEHAQYDKKRTLELNELRIKVIRFINEDVVYDIKGVLEEITKHLNPNPFPQGEGSGPD
ncbi:UNVERIFIED_CONTAM: hypothetical protein GTU68_042225 [Idotea baltica]|nr:hypothetical protein [Idotea baltica]